MDWFMTTIKQNNSFQNRIAEFPSHILELWECTQCLNVIYQQKYHYSPFHPQHQTHSTFHLENVLISFTQSSQFKNKTHHLLNSIHVYCKTCPKSHLLAQLIPQRNPLNNQFSYRLSPETANIQKTQIIMGKTNFKKLAANQSRINSQNDPLESLSQERLKRIKKDVQNQIMLWYQSKNFRIYQGFTVHSERKRKNLDHLKGFLIKMNPNLSRKERNCKKILKHKQRASNSFGIQSSVSQGYE